VRAARRRRPLGAWAELGALSERPAIACGTVINPAAQPRLPAVYAGALRALQDHLGADTSLAVLDEARTAKARVGGWFHRRYGQTAPATLVRQLAIPALGLWLLAEMCLARD